MTGRLKTIVWLGTGLCVAGAGAYLVMTQGAREPKPAAAAIVAPAPTISVIAARVQEIVDTILINGSLVAREEIMVGPELDGLRITEIIADEGDHVTRGQVLARLTREMLDVQLTQNDAMLARAAASIAQARSQIAQADAANIEANASLDRSRSLARSGFASQEILDQRISAARSAVARLAAARDGVVSAVAVARQVQAQRAELELRIARTEIKAPVDGVISRRIGRIGGLTAMNADALFRIVAKGEIELEGEVPESRLGALKPGQGVRVEIASMAPVQGRVRLVPAEIDRMTRLARVRVALPVGADLRVGQFARGLVEVDRRTAITLPLSAVVFDQDNTSVQIVRAGKVETRAVTLGINAGGRVEIRDGLVAGEQIVLRAGAFLRDGDAVSPVLTEDARGRS